MKRKLFTKVLAAALAAAVCFTGINFSPFIDGREVMAAKEQEKENYEKYLQDTKVEIVEERTKDSNTYQLADGSKELVIYTEPIRYEDDEGNLIDYDASLKEISHTDEKSRSKNEREGYLYENTQGDMKNYIPAHVSEDTPILMEKDDMAIRISPVTGTKTSAFSKTKEFQPADEIMQEVETIYEKEVTDRMGVSYETAAQEMELQYYSFASGIKEAIVLNERPDSNVFAFRLDLQGLTPRLNELIGSVELIGDDGKTVEAFIEAPFMNDATDKNYSEDLYYEIEANADGSYQLILTVDQEYLDTAEYPVEIDPTTTWGTDPVIYDAYVIKGSTYGDTNFFSDSISVQCTGNASQGTMRQYMMMLDFYVILKGYCVTSAKLYLYESGAYTAGNTIQVRYPTTPWSLYTLTWNNQPTCSAPIATATTAGKLNSEVVLDITTYARGLAAGTLRNYGIMYQNVNESSGFNKFYGARNSVTSKRPKLVVNYVDGPTAPSAVSISPTYVKPGGQFTYTWSGINTSYLSYVQYRTANSSGTNLVNYTTSSKIGTTSSGTKVFTVPSDWSSGTYTTYVRGVDTGGIAGGEKGASFVVDGNIPSLPNPTLSPATSETNYSSSLPTITWAASDTNFKDIYFTTNTGATWTLLSTSKSGTVTLPASSFPTSGKYKINLRAYDKAGNYGTSGSVYYYYDVTAPLFKQLEMSPDAYLESTPSKNTTPTMTWLFEENEAISLIQCSIDGGEYFDIGTTISGSYTIPEGKLVGAGEHTIAIRAIDSAGNASEGVATSYWLDDTSINMDDYVITDANITNLYGKNVISWTNKTEVPALIETRVYRSEQSGFTPSADNLVYEGVADSYWADMDGTGKTYYYRIAMIRKNVNGVVVEERLYETELTGTSYSVQSSTVSRTGNMYWGSYFYYDTPTGDGSIEKSSGNHMYSQEDFSLSNSQLSYGLDRIYNSNLNFSGMFGEGWLDSWHVELYEGLNECLYFLQTDGTIYSFCVDATNSMSTSTVAYRCIESASHHLEKNQNGYSLNVDGGEVYTFNLSGQLLKISETNGNAITYDYDELGRLSIISSIPNEGPEKTIQLLYDGDSRLLSSITLPDNTILEYDFSNNHLVKTTHFNADKTDQVSYEYVYDENGKLSVIKDAKGQPYTIKYSDTKATKVTYPNGDYHQLAFGDGTTTVAKYNDNDQELYTEATMWDPSTGKIVSFVDTLGNVSNYNYNYADNMLLYTEIQTEAAYQEVVDNVIVRNTQMITSETQYNSNEDVVEIVDGVGNETIYEYDTDGNLISEETISDAGEVLSNNTYTYFDDNNLSSSTDHIENIEISYTYDENGNLETEIEQQTDGVTRSVQQTYEATYVYDSEGNEVSAGIESGSITTSSETEYDTMGRVVRETENNVTTTYLYDFMGRVIETTATYADGFVETTHKSYDDNGTLLSEVLEDGTRYSYAYDALNRLTQREMVRESTTSYGTSYGMESNLLIKDGFDGYACNLAYVQTESMNGNLISKTYTDVHGRTVRTIVDGVYTDYSYDDSGNQLSSITYTNNEDGLLTVYAYDVKGNLVATIVKPGTENANYSVGNDSVLTKSEYDEAGNLTKTTSANGISTGYNYDETGRLTSIVENYGGENPVTSSLEYITSSENFTTICTDANGNKSIEITDAAGLLLSAIDEGADGKEISTYYSYNTDGKLIKTTYADGSYEIYTYDDCQFLTEKQCYSNDDVLEYKTTYSYDRKGNLLTTIDSERKSSGEIEPYFYTVHEYDSYNREIAYGEFIQASTPTEEEKQAMMVRYEYDDEDYLVKIIYPAVTGSDINSLIYHYNDTKTQLDRIGVVKNETETTLRQYSYDDLGQISQIRTYTDEIGNSNYTDLVYGYDDFGRLVAMTYKDAAGDEKETHAYVYDKDSNILSHTEHNTYSDVVSEQLNRKREYSYDEFGQLIKTVETDYNNDEISTTEYTYDSIGNRLGKSVDGEVTTYTYNTLDQLTSYQTIKNGVTTEQITCTYDARGNQITENDSVSGISKTNVYTVSGYLAMHTIASQGTNQLVQQNVYNGDGQRILKSENEEVIKYVYANSGVLCTLDENDAVTSFNLYGDSANLIATVREVDDQENLYFYNSNIEGSTTSILDDDTTSVGLYSYTDFGETSEVQNVTIENEICFTGAIYDETTGLYYLNARYYNPVTGRFISQDTYRGEDNIPDTWHLYVYCANNPIAYTDPSGHFGTPIQWVCAAIGAIAGWYFGDYVAKKLGYAPSGKGKANAAKYWTIRTAVVVGGAAVGWFAGTVMVKWMIRYLSANPSVMAKAPGAVLWFLGLKNKSLSTKSVVDLLLSAKRVGSAKKTDIYHRSASYLSKKQLLKGKAFYIKSGDGKKRILFQVNGQLNGKKGVFEYIIERNGTISHQLFKVGRKIDGKSN